jgi:hypothetical protein
MEGRSGLSSRGVSHRDILTYCRYTLLCAEWASIHLGRALVTVAYICAFVAYAGMLEISCCTGSVIKVSSNGPVATHDLVQVFCFPSCIYPEHSTSRMEQSALNAIRDQHIISICMSVSPRGNAEVHMNVYTPSI